MIVDPNSPASLYLDKSRFLYMVNKLLYHACQRSYKGQKIIVQFTYIEDFDESGLEEAIFD